ncbi:ABC transporter substrate-binding protein [uncultured Cohaesibacter sp.]|uniref:ABC transporter substrate-binding protein n=1 Tax=uncultured Cohaesibacter sp. TaxID=1002546 RepID=UPI002AA6AADB|nr:ABC transporter substrate-binding protein [uncultured Cohaesibacter sp.]
MNKSILAAGLAVLALSSAMTSSAFAEDKVSIVANATQIFGTIDPAKINDYTEYMAAVNFYDGLTTVTPEGTIAPQLAESWTVSDDNKTYTFKLKSGATFQDGTPVEAKDVVYSMKRLLALNNGPAYLFKDLVSPESVTAVDASTVEIKLNKVYSPFLTITPLILVVNEDLVEAEDKGEWAEDYLGQKPAGAGPYAMKSWSRGSELIMERYKGYHDGWTNGTPIDEVRFVITNDEATVKALAQKGELGMSAYGHSNETFDAIAKMDGYKIVSTPTATGFNIKLNSKKAPTDDVHVRRAIALATDYETIRDVIFPSAEMKGPLAPVFSEAFLDTLEAPKYDLEAAKAELAKSKYAGQPIKISLSYVAGLGFEEEIALLLQSTLPTIGIEVELQPEPWNRITELASKQETTPNATQVIYGPTYPSPDSVFYVQYHSATKGTWASMEWLLDKDLDALISKARESTDVSEQNAIYKEIQQNLVDRQSDVYIGIQEKRMATSVCLQGYKLIPMQSWDYDFSNFWWDCDAK